MAKGNAYQTIVVESYVPSSTSGRHGNVHVRPVAGQAFPQSLSVECSRRLVTDYPVGTKFRIQVKLPNTRRESAFLYSYHGWPFEVLT